MPPTISETSRVIIAWRALLKVRVSDFERSRDLSEASSWRPCVRSVLTPWSREVREKEASKQDAEAERPRPTQATVR